MLKTVSSITNAIGALNFKGTWNAATNTPTIVSGVGVKGDYFVVSVAGSTTIDGISNWGVGDWITYNGTVWQRVEGGADLNGVNLSVSGTTTLSGLTASTALALNASKEVVSVTNTGTGDNVLATSPTLVGDVTLSTGSVVVSSGEGIDFAAAGGDILAQYDEFTAASTACQNAITTACVWKLTKIGNQVTITLPKVTGTAGGSNVNFVLGANIPSAYRPSADIGFYGATVINNGAVVTAPGFILITTGGTIIVYRDAGGLTALTNGATAGLNEALGISWTI